MDRRRGGAGEFRIQPDGKIARLRRLDLLSGLDDEALKELSRLSSWRVYEQGEEVRQPSQRAEVAHVVLEGCVERLALSTDGRVLKIAQIEAGEALDFGRAHDAEPGLTVAKVRSRCALICTVARPVFLRTVLANERPALTFLEQEQRSRQRAERLARELAFETVATRVRHQLHWLTTETGERLIFCTVEDLAQRAGTRPEEASRVVADLARRGLVIRRGRGGIEIPDADALP